MIVKCLLLQINHSMVIDCQKGIQTTAMIIVSMGNNNSINLRKIYAQCFCIFDKQIRRSHIEQQLMFLRLRINTEPVLCPQLTLRCVFHQCYKLHDKYPHPFT